MFRQDFLFCDCLFFAVRDLGNEGFQVRLFGDQSELASTLRFFSINSLASVRPSLTIPSASPNLHPSVHPLGSSAISKLNVT